MKYVRIENTFLDDMAVYNVARDCGITPVETIGHLTLLMAAMAELSMNGELNGPSEFVHESMSEWIEFVSHWSRLHPEKRSRNKFALAVQKHLLVSGLFVAYHHANAAPLKEAERQRNKAARLRARAGE